MIALLTLLIFAVFGSGLFVGAIVGIRLSETEPTPTPIVYPTGQQVLSELQEYRKREGLPPFELSSILCNNISERWQNYVENNSHKGFKEFVNANYPPGFSATEILVAGVSAREMVEKWASSPSHNLYIHDNSKACVYSAKGSSVALLSN